MREAVRGDEAVARTLSARRGMVAQRPRHLLALLLLLGWLLVPATARAAPAITVTPASPAAGVPFTVTGSGYPANAVLHLFVADAAGNPLTAPVGATVGADGSFAVSLTAPAGTPAGQYALVIRRGGVTPAPQAAAPGGALTIPVLEYHDVGYGQGTYQVTLAAFRQQLDWLQAHGYTTVTLPQVYAALLAGGPLPAKPVVLTFDDGRASQWDAVQELNARGMTGVFFVQGGGVGLSAAQLRQIAAWGHEIEAHSMTHADLTRLSDAQLRYEVAGAKQALEGQLGLPIRYFAYPYGAYDARVIAAVAAAGYQGGLAAWGGASWTAERRWEQPRIIVSGYATLDDFAALVTSATP